MTSARSPRCGRSGTRRSRRRARRRLPRACVRRTGRSRSSASARSSSCCAAGSRTRARPRAARRCIALEASRATHPGDVNAFRPLLHELAARDPNVAVRRLAIVCLRNGTPAARRRSRSSTGSPTTTTRTPSCARTARIGLGAARQEVASEVGSDAWRGRPSSGSSWARAPTGRRCGTPPRRSTQLGVPVRARRSCRRTARRTSCSSTPASAEARGLQVRHRRCRWRGPSARDDRRRRRAAGARRPGRVEERCRASTRCSRSLRCLPACPSGRSRSGAPGAVNAALLAARDRRALGRAVSASGWPRLRAARRKSVLDRARSVRVTALVGVHRRRPARAHARRSPGAPLGRSPSASSTRAGATAPAVGELVVGAYDDPPLTRHGSPTAPTSSRTSSRTSRSRRPRRVDAVPHARGARARPGPASSRRSCSGALGIPTARSARWTDAGVPALVKSRRLGYDGKGQRRRRARRGARRATSWPRRSSRSTASCRSSPRAARRLTRASTARRERAPRRNPRASRGLRHRMRRRRQAERARRDAARRPRLRRRARASSCSSVGGELLANEVRAAGPQHRATGRSTAPATSQFENHLRAILGLPLGSTEALGRDAVMVNLVGVVPPLERLLARARCARPPLRRRSHGPGESSATSRSSTRMRRRSPRSSRLPSAAWQRLGGRSRRAAARACARAGAPGSTPRGVGGPTRACSARSSRDRRGRASPAPSGGRRRPRGGASRRSDGGGAGGRARARALRARPACAGSGTRRRG